MDNLQALCYACLPVERRFAKVWRTDHAPLVGRTAEEGPELFALESTVTGSNPGHTAGTDMEAF